MQEITETEAIELALTAAEFQIIEQDEDEKTASSVTLKKLPTGYILNVSCAGVNQSKHYFSENLDSVNQLTQNYLRTLREKGNPFLDNGMSEDDLKELASQLGKPEGEKGIQVGQMMNETNISMTRNTLENLSLKGSDTILELGHGNANHLLELFEQAKNLQYFGLDVSELMKQEAEKFASEYALEEKAKFQLFDGTNIPFADNLFDKIFTVNTIYFWQKPQQLIAELHRVLKPDGVLCITFVDEETMNQLTFTDFGFTKYNQNTLEKLIETSALETTELKQHSEILKTKMLGDVERKYWVAKLTKQASNKKGLQRS